MKLTLHHLNLCTRNVKEMDEFYADVLDMKPEPSMSSRWSPGPMPSAMTQAAEALSAGPPLRM